MQEKQVHFKARENGHGHKIGVSYLIQDYFDEGKRQWSYKIKCKMRWDLEIVPASVPKTIQHVWRWNKVWRYNRYMTKMKVLSCNNWGSWDKSKAPGPKKTHNSVRMGPAARRNYWVLLWFQWSPVQLRHLIFNSMHGSLATLVREAAKTTRIFYWDSGFRWIATSKQQHQSLFNQVVNLIKYLFMLLFVPDI